jgi:hypothetical protein
MHTGQQCRTHLMTEGSFASTSQAPKLIEACESRELTQTRPWGAQLAAQLGTDAETAARFLAGFRATAANVLGPRAACGPINAVKLRSWLKATRLGETLDTQCYALLRNTIADCCRAAVTDPVAGSTLLDASRHPTESRTRARIASRTLNREQTVACMLDVPTGSPMLTGDPASLDHTRMTLKLERGAVPPQVVAVARRLRASWYEYESSQTIRAPGSEPGLTDIRTRTLLAVADAVAGLDLTEPYGQSMYRTVREHLTVSGLGPVAVLGLSDELLLGLVFQATDECELFWSAPFNVDGPAT